MYFFSIRIVLKMMIFAGYIPDIWWQKYLYHFNRLILVISLHQTIMPFYMNDVLSFVQVTGALESATIMIHALMKLTCIAINRSSLFALLKETLRFWKIEEIQYESEKNEALSFLKYMKIGVILFVLCSLVVSFLILFRPFLVAGRITSLDGYVPEDPFWYGVVVIAEFMAFLVAYVSIMPVDLIFSSLVMLAVVQVKLLNYEFRRVFSMRVNTDEEKVLVREKLKGCIDYHMFLLNYARKVNATFSTLILHFLMVFVFSNCLEMFMLSKVRSLVEAVKYLLYITNATNEFVLFYCIPCELLSNEIEKTKGYMFDSDWNLNFEFLKTEMLMISMLSEKCKIITAGNFVEISMTTCLAALKTMVSYYMFMTNVNQQ